MICNCCDGEYANPCHASSCVCYFTNAHTLSHTHTHTLSQHTGTTVQMKYREAAASPNRTEDQETLFNNMTAGRKYLAHVCFPCWWYAMAVSVPFVCSYSRCLLPASILFLSHTHTGIAGGKYVCVHLYMYWWYAIAMMMNMLTLVMLPLVYVISPMLSVSAHTHTGSAGGKYVCVHLYMYWWYAIAVMMKIY